MDSISTINSLKTNQIPSLWVQNSMAKIIIYGSDLWILKSEAGVAATSKIGSRTPNQIQTRVWKVETRWSSQFFMDNSEHIVSIGKQCCPLPPPPEIYERHYKRPIKAVKIPCKFFDLHNKVAKMMQGTLTLEDFWLTMQSLWGEIEAWRLNPMVCRTNITAFNQIWNETKMYRFLGEVNSKFDGIKWEILREDRLRTLSQSGVCFCAKRVCQAP